jgi:hypothetical protein
MAGPNWDKESDGSITFCPYVGHRIATMSDKIGIVRLMFVVSPAQQDADSHGLQLALSREQARELAAGLLTMADAPHIPAPPTQSQH